MKGITVDDGAVCAGLNAEAPGVLAEAMLASTPHRGEYHCTAARAMSSGEFGAPAGRLAYPVRDNRTARRAFGMAPRYCGAQRRFVLASGEREFSSSRPAGRGTAGRPGATGA